MFIKKFKNFIKESADFIIKFCASALLSFFENIGIKLLNIKKIHLNKKDKLEAIDNAHTLLKKSYNNTLPDKLNGYKVINKEFIFDLAYVTQTMIKKSQINIDHGKILYSLIYHYCSKKKLKSINIVETGTAKAFSAICMAKALSDLDMYGKIYTFDLFSHNKDIIWNNISDIDKKISRKNLISNWNELIDKYIIFISGYSHINLKRIFFGRVHFAFIDGSHFGHDINYELQEISKYQLSGDQILFDDYNDKRFVSLTNHINLLCNKMGYKKEYIPGSNNRNYLLAIKI